MEHIFFFMLLVLFCLSIQDHGAIAKGTEEYLQCNGSIAECQEQNEMLMPSETARRLEEHGKYISIGALSRDQPACSGGTRGQAYSNNNNCLPPSANPYHRSCSKYYRCRSDS